MRQRVLQGAPATLTVTFADQDGAPVDATGTVTVLVAQADGTVVLPLGSATVHGDTGVYTVALTAAQTAQLNLLTATWTDAGNTRVIVSEHEIVGGYFFSLADARTSNDGLLEDESTYSDEDILSCRQEVEEEAEVICDVAFVPRYNRVALDGDATTAIVLPDNRIRTIRSVRIYPVTGGTLFVSFTPTQLAGLAIGDDSTIRRTDFGFFDEGRANIIVEYEHGWDLPPSDLRRASLTRLRSRLNYDKGGINDRATTFTAENGQSYKLATAEAFRTGIPEVDAAYGRYSFRELGGDGARPVSRQLNYDPQRYSIFHGGVR